MTTQVYLCPTFGIGYQGFTNAGLPNNAGTISTYIAGGTTPQATYTDSAGSTQNANPIVLDATGYAPSEVWLLAGQAYRLDLKDSLGNLIKTYDNVTGINDPAVASAPNVLTSVAGTNTITASVIPAITAYANGQKFILSAANTNTGATTLNINGIGAKSVFSGGVALAGGELVVSVSSLIEYDGTQFNIINSAPFVDTRPLVIGSSDATKRLRIEVDGLTTATTRIWTAADLNIALGKQPTRQVLTSGSAATYTTPSGATRINVRMVGAGGGGAAGSTNAGSTGAATTFSSLTANGGVGGTNTGGAGGAGGTASGGDINISGASGSGGSATGNVSGASGGNSVFGGGGGGSNGGNTAGLNAATNSGSGGGGGTSTGAASGGGGGAGGYCEKLITAPASTYTYTVGGKGAGGSAGGNKGGDGGDGLIVVDEYYN